MNGFSIVNWDENEDMDDEEMEENADPQKTDDTFIDKNLVFDINEPTQPVPDFEPDYFGKCCQNFNLLKCFY